MNRWREALLLGCVLICAAACIALLLLLEGPTR
jgi:hypothetical protein